MDGYGAEAPAVSGDDSFANDFSAERASDDHLDSVITSTFDKAQEIADWKQGEHDVRDAEIARRNPTEDQLFESAVDAAQMRTDRRTDRFKSPEDERPADETAKPTEAPATERAEYERWAQDDREFIAKQPPEVQQWVQAKKAEYAGIDAFSEKWAPYFGQMGVAPEQMTQAVDLLMSTEQGLRTGTPDQKRQILAGLIHDYKIEIPGGQITAEALGIQGQEAEIATSAIQTERALRSASPQQRVDIFNQLLQQYPVQIPQQARPQRQAPPDPRMAQAQQQQAFQQRHQQAQADIRSYLVDNPSARPLMERMTSLYRGDMQNGQPPDLKSLHERAAGLEPDIVARHRDETEKAKRAGGGISGSGTSSTIPPTTLHGVLSDAYDRQAA